MACVNPPGFSSWPRRLGVQGVQDDSANVGLSPPEVPRISWIFVEFPNTPLGKGDIW